MKKVIISIFFVLLLILSFHSLEAGKWKRLIDKPTFELFANPLNYNTIFAGGEGRYVYRSYDAGKTWDTLTINWSNYSAMMNNVMVTPYDTNTIILGGLNFRDLRRSTNQGEDWEIVLSPDHGVELNGKALAYKPDQPNVIYLGEFTTGIVFKSTDNGRTWDSISRIMEYRNGKLVEGEIASIGIRQDTSDILFANTMTSKVFISTDGGYNWRVTDTLTTPPYGNDCEITRMLFSKRDPMVGYVTITYVTEGNQPNGGLHKTTDGGYNWESIAFADTSLWAVAVREVNGQDEVFVGGYTEHYHVPFDFKIVGNGLIAGSTDGGKTWHHQGDEIDWVIEKPNLTLPFNDLFFPSRKYGFCVRDEGGFFRTGDSGHNWTSNLTADKYNNDFNSIFFHDENEGFVAGGGGLIIKTTDGGLNWQTMTTDTEEELYSIEFADDKIGIAVGANGAVLKTTNSGKDWRFVNSNSDKSLYSVTIGNQDLMYAGGDEGTILRSTTSGNFWHKSGGDFNTKINSLAAITKDIVLAAGENGMIYKTGDAGGNWHSVDPDVKVALNDIFLLNDNMIYACGDKGVIIRSTSKGDSWERVDNKIARNLNSIVFNDDSTGLAAGEMNLIVISLDTAKSWSEVYNGHGPRNNVWSMRYWGPPGEEKLYLATEAGLFVQEEPSPIGVDYIHQDKDARLQIYRSSPGTFNVKYRKFSSNPALRLEFSITDLLGNTILKQELKNGSSQVINRTIPIPNIANGVYICRMIEGSKVSHYKIIIE